MSKHEIDNQHDINEDEIDIFKILQVVFNRWKLLFVVGVLGLILGIVFSLNIAKQFTAEAKIKLFKQTLNDLTEDKDTKFHVLKLEDKIFIEKFKEELKNQNNLSDDQLLALNFGLKPTHDTRKAPGIVFLKTVSADKDMSIVFLELLNKKYSDLLKDDLNKLRNIKITELEARKKEYFQKLKEFEKELRKFDSSKILIYDCEDQLKSGMELQGAFKEYKDIVKQKELLEYLLPTLENASPAEICDAFKTTCSDLANIDRIPGNNKVNLISSSDKEWSIVAEYRKKESKFESLKKQLELADSMKLSSDKITTIKNNLSDAEIDLKTFAKVTLNQLKARNSLLNKQEKALLKKIAAIQKFQQGMQLEFIKYKEVKNRYNSLKKNYQLVSDKLTEEIYKPQVKYYCEIINQPKITKTNFTKRFSLIILTPLIFIGFAAFLLIFLKAYMEHNRQQPEKYKK